jgi:hypothetical protein
VTGDALATTLTRGAVPTSLAGVAPGGVGRRFGCRNTGAKTGANFLGCLSSLALYDQLLGIIPTPVVSLNRAVAVAEVQGPAAALDCVEAIAPELDAYYPFHAVRADLLVRADRKVEALEAYEAAIVRTDNETERAFLRRRVRAPQLRF